MQKTYKFKFIQHNLYKDEYLKVRTAGTVLNANSGLMYVIITYACNTVT